MEIIAKQIGAGEGFIEKDGRLQDIVALLNDGIVQAAFGQEGVVHRLVIDRRSTPVQASIDTSGQWHSAYGPDVLQQAIYVPALADLGFDEDDYRFQARLAPIMNDNTGSIPVVDLRLLDAAYQPVSGSEVQGTLTAGGADEALVGDTFDLPGPGAYKIDFKAEAGKTATMRSQVLILQIVRTS